jgi:glycosyltransferase involved in cell wall biosynthesis
MSKPRVSVVVPTYNSAEYVEACLRSIREQSYDSIELIVVDNNSQDNTKAIAARYTPHVYNCGPERSSQRNHGVLHSSGQYVLMIDSDMELTRNVVSECLAKIISNSRLQALTIPEESFGEGFWTQCKKLERSCYRGIHWQEAARFFRREVYGEMGGYDEQITGSEDYDLPSRIEHKYGRQSIGSVSELIYHNERRLSLWRLCRKKFYYATTLRSYIDKPENRKRFSNQVSLSNRLGVLVKDPGKLLRNPVYSVGMFLMKLCEFTCGLAGFLYGEVKHRTRTI